MEFLWWGADHNLRELILGLHSTWRRFAGDLGWLRSMQQVPSLPASHTQTASLTCPIRLAPRREPRLRSPVEAAPLVPWSNCRMRPPGGARVIPTGQGLSEEHLTPTRGPTTYQQPHVFLKSILTRTQRESCFLRGSGGSETEAVTQCLHL